MEDRFPLKLNVMQTIIIITYNLLFISIMMIKIEIKLGDRTIGSDCILYSE